MGITSFSHQVGTLIRLRDAITAALSLHLEPWSETRGCVRAKYASSELLHDQTQPGRACLNSMRSSWHHSMVGVSFFYYQGRTLIQLRDAIITTPSSCSEPSSPLELSGRAQSNVARRWMFLSIEMLHRPHQVGFQLIFRQAGTLIQLCET